jgi:ABC-type uncharacterized transport system permease subunit
MFWIGLIVGLIAGAVVCLLVAIAAVRPETAD